MSSNEVLKVGHYNIGPDEPPFIIAEMSGNHNRSLERALAIVDAAAKAGVHALKIQTYTADTMTLDCKENEFFISDKTSLWHGNSLYELYMQAHTPWEWHKSIFERCREHGMIGFSSPFDFTAVDFLETLNVPLYKVASFENIDIPLIRKIAQTGKPMILSTGAANLAELNEAVSAIRQMGNENIVLLKCTSAYPADPKDCNLATIPHMKKLFDCQVGLSDHTLGLSVPIAGVALGAAVIEKHFTLSRAEGGVDSAFSLEPAELHELVIESKRAWEALGRISYQAASAEEKSKQFRRTLYAVKDIHAGEEFTVENIRAIRPGKGLPPKYIDIIMGKKANCAIKKGTALSWDLLL